LRLSARPEEPANDINKAPVGAVHIVAASSTSSANCCGASYGGLCPMPPLKVRCECLPENFLA
jgi:hypothetical protein